MRSFITYSKLRPSLPSRLFYEPRLRYEIETFSPKIGENIEMLVCFICVGTQDRILTDIVIIYYYSFFIFRNEINKLKTIEMNLYKGHLVDIWFTNSAWAFFRYPAFNFRFKSFY